VTRAVVRADVGLGAHQLADRGRDRDPRRTAAQQPLHDLARDIEREGLPMNRRFSQVNH
jgi:hypothetical protein